MIIEEGSNHCPELFYCNCKNAGIKCNTCLAGSGEESFHYLPVNSKYPKYKHPYIIEQRAIEREVDKERKTSTKYKQAKSNRYKGRASEKQLTNKLNSLKFNPTSISNDGKVILKDGSEFGIELKTRLTKFTWPTKKEWEKFKQQSLKFFIVKDDNTGEHRVCMELKVLNELIDLANINISNGNED